jgi:uncharacterized small protein (DUF1192 family)
MVFSLRGPEVEGPRTSSMIAPGQASPPAEAKMPLDADELDPPKKKKLEWPDFERLSIGELNEFIAELEAAIGRIRGVIGRKQSARGSADSVFKR